MGQEAKEFFEKFKSDVGKMKQHIPVVTDTLEMLLGG